MRVQKAAVNLYATNDLKNTSDDNLGQALNDTGFKQSFFFDNVRLALGYVLVALTGVVAWVEFTKGWKEASSSIINGVILYVVLTLFYYYWTLRVMKSAVYIGQKDKQILYIKSTSKKNSADYHIELEVNDLNGRILGENSASGQYSDWFDEKGWLVPNKFSQFVKQVAPIDNMKTK